MKSKIIQIFVGLVISATSLSAQEADTVDIFFDYELLASGKTTITGDSVYNAVFKIDTASLKLFKRLTVIGNDKEKIFSVKAADIATNPDFAVVGDSYLYSSGEWSGVMAWSVKGKKHDDSEVFLKNKKDEEKVIHKVIVQKKPRTLKRNFSATNPAEETEQ